MEGVPMVKVGVTGTGAPGGAALAPPLDARIPNTAPPPSAAATATHFRRCGELPGDVAAEVARSAVLSAFTGPPFASTAFASTAPPFASPMYWKETVPARA